jgi:cell division protein FtsW
MLTSASQVMGLDKFQDPYYYLKHQLFFGLLPGIALLIIFSNLKFSFWKKIAIPLFAGSIILLILVLIPQLSYGYAGAKRWLYLSFFSIQPSEIIKLSLIIFLAAWFSQKKGEMKNFHHTVLPFIMYLGIISLLIAFEPDIGTLSVIIVIALALYWTAGAKLAHIAGIVLIGILTMGLLIKAAPYRVARITAFFSPEADTQGISYQINQSLLAIGSGGLFGLGLGQSKQKYQYLPEVVGDSVFAVIAEELGFIITSLFIFLYLYFALNAFRIAEKSHDNFAKYTAVGIATWLTYQALVNMGAMVKITPLTGLPLPFISYGSSAMITSLAAIGILINISKYTRS